MAYKIRVKGLEGDILTFKNVKKYSAAEGLIEFIDEKTGKKKIFSTHQCEIEPEEEKEVSPDGRAS